MQRRAARRHKGLVDTRVRPWDAARAPCAGGVAGAGGARAGVRRRAGRAAARRTRACREAGIRSPLQKPFRFRV